MLVCFYSIPLVHRITVDHCVVNINNHVFSFLFLCVVEKHQSVQIAERPVGNQPKAKTVCGMSVLSAVLLSILVIVLIVFVVTIFIFLTLGVYFLK